MWNPSFVKWKLLAVSAWSEAETSFSAEKSFSLPFGFASLQPSSWSKTAAAAANPLISLAAATVCKLVSCLVFSSVCRQSTNWPRNNNGRLILNGRTWHQRLQLRDVWWKGWWMMSLSCWSLQYYWESARRVSLRRSLLYMKLKIKIDLQTDFCGVRLQMIY